jgi:hypothetical protein
LRPATVVSTSPTPPISCITTYACPFRRFLCASTCSRNLQGINEQQSFANKLGDNSLQHHINEENFAVLNDFVREWGAAAVGVGSKKLKRWVPLWGCLAPTRPTPQHVL